MTILFAREPRRMVWRALLWTLLVWGLTFWASAALATASNEGALPWDTPIDRIGQAITGPVAFLFALGGMVVLGIRWIFGGEMGGMVRALLNTVIGICLLVLAARFIQVLFGVSGALVAG